VGFEHTIAAGERPQTYALDRAATRTGFGNILLYQIEYDGQRPMKHDQFDNIRVIKFSTGVRSILATAV